MATDDRQGSLFDDDGALLPENNLVVKANRFITAKYDWTPMEHRIVAMLIAQLRRDDASFATQKVHIADLIKLSGSNSKDLYARGEEICQKLLSQTIEVRAQTEDGRRLYEGYNLMSSCRYVEGSGHILAKFNDDMKPFLLELRRRFTMYRLQFLMRLNSQYSARLYEFIKMREDLGFFRISIKEFREHLCLETKYTRSFADLKAHVIEKAREEIKAKCDRYFTYYVERKGRTPVRLTFMIHENEDVRPPLSEEEIGDIEVEASDDQGAAFRRASEAARDATRPRLEGYEMFLTDRTQEELASLSAKDLRALREEAEAAVDRRHPDAAASYRAAQVHLVMTRLWTERHAR
jgi:plasmid replication initiation protein